jgi:hypothetical protein
MVLGAICKQSSVNNRSGGLKIGINGILQICNLVVGCLIFFGFFKEELMGHKYIDWLTLTLGLALCVQTQIVLRLEKRNPDPFVIIMSYIIIFFYALRIFTLLIYPVQDVFARNLYGPSDSNYALCYILLINTCLYSGLYRLKLGGFNEIQTEGISPKRPRIGLALFVISLIFSMVPADLNPPLWNIIYQNFLRPNTVLLVLAAYVLIFRHQLPARYISIVIGGLIILLIMQTLAFSRSGLLTMVEQMLIVTLAVAPSIRVSRKYILTSLLILPILVAFAVNIYSISTITRSDKGDKGRTFIEKVELMQESIEKHGDSVDSNIFIGHAFARMGYLDFTAEVISNNERYHDIFNAEKYLKSMFDNILSPGFDLFDQPLISHSLKYSYGTLGEASKKNEMNHAHTDQFGLYGELHNLFGYASPLIAYFVAYYVKLFFLRSGTINPHRSVLNRIIILFAFHQWMNSFGIDWIILNVVVTSVTFFCVSKIFIIRFKARSN